MYVYTKNDKIKLINVSAYVGWHHTSNYSRVENREVGGGQKSLRSHRNKQIGCAAHICNLCYVRVINSG
jgi:hypothetical protein